MRVLITGATGLVGKAIVKQCLEKGIEVNYLTTQKSKVAQIPNCKGFYWHPKKQEIDTACFNGVTAIVHLAGASISKRWTRFYKKIILNSRIESTRLLVNSLKGELHTVNQVISASAIGIYPDSKINYYDENFKVTESSFLSRVAMIWEQEVDAFNNLGITVAKIRIGLVLSNKGGALPVMLKPIQYNLGAAFGSGMQWQSWIHIQDLSRLFVFVLTHNLSGVYNAVAPNAVTNMELTKTLARILGSTLFLPNIPKWLMKLVLGDRHVLLFESQRVSSKKIESKNFYFKHHHLQLALEDLLH